MTRWQLLLITGVMAAMTTEVRPDRLAVQRREVFEFTEKPLVERRQQGRRDEWVIVFATRDYCDVTVAVEDAEGRVVRHLASGVLGCLLYTS
ncbi:MAG: hypothetical protein N2255_10670, partial [Kiritimatiellae bacterium]|nr:hypothetical protein [Kiritimatiellia bacterium]